MPGTLARIQRAVFAEATGPTPASRIHLLVEPHVAGTIHEAAEPLDVVDVVGLDEVGAGADLLFHPVGAPLVRAGCKGSRRAPRKIAGGVVSLRPERKVPSSRMVFSVRNRLMQSKSNTGFAPGWSPTPTPSPVRHRMLPTPMAAAPSTSPWMAMRLRSRQEICKHDAEAGARQDRADAHRRHVAIGAGGVRRVDGIGDCGSGSAAFNTSRGSALSGGFSSAVTANKPLAQRALEHRGRLVPGRRHERRVQDGIVGFGRRAGGS